MSPIDMEENEEIILTKKAMFGKAFREYVRKFGLMATADSAYIDSKKEIQITNGPEESGVRRGIFDGESTIFEITCPAMENSITGRIIALANLNQLKSDQANPGPGHYAIAIVRSDHPDLEGKLFEGVYDPQTKKGYLEEVYIFG